MLGYQEEVKGVGLGYTKPLLLLLREERTRRRL